MPFDFKRINNVPDVVRIIPGSFRDDRGWFTETYKQSDFSSSGIEYHFVQENHSMSNQRGVVRGLHYQMDPAAQGKLVRCLRGSVFDVAVDLRKGSPSYGKWVGETISAESKLMLWMPPGFAHGFQTLTDYTEILYKTTHEYNPKHERTLRWDDPEIGIKWPVDDPILNDRDRTAPILKEVENNFLYLGGDA